MRAIMRRQAGGASQVEGEDVVGIGRGEPADPAVLHRAARQIEVGAAQEGDKPKL